MNFFCKIFNLKKALKIETQNHKKIIRYSIKSSLYWLVISEKGMKDGLNLISNHAFTEIKLKDLSVNAYPIGQKISI
jgi:hypothetical protein